MVAVHNIPIPTFDNMIVSFIRLSVIEGISDKLVLSREKYFLPSLSEDEILLLESVKGGVAED